MHFLPRMSLHAHPQGPRHMPWGHLLACSLGLQLPPLLAAPESREGLELRPRAEAMLPFSSPSTRDHLPILTPTETLREGTGVSNAAPAPRRPTMQRDGAAWLPESGHCSQTSTLASDVASHENTGEKHKLYSLCLEHIPPKPCRPLLSAAQRQQAL